MPIPRDFQTSRMQPDNLHGGERLLGGGGGGEVFCFRRAAAAADYSPLYVIVKRSSDDTARLTDGVDVDSAIIGPIAREGGTGSLKNGISNTFSPRGAEVFFLFFF